MIQLSTAAGPLKFVNIDIFGRLPKTTNRNHYNNIIRGKFSKWTGAFSTAKVNLVHIVTIFLNDVVRLYRIASKHQTDNDHQYVRKRFSTRCFFLDVSKVRTKAYDPETNLWVERFNRTMVTSMHHYVSEHQRDRDS